MTHSIEIAPFIIKDEVTTEILLEKADFIQKEFLSKQPGFISRKLSKKSESEFADIVIWKDETHAKNASALAMQSNICAEYFSLMQMDKELTLGFCHLTELKSW